MSADFGVADVHRFPELTDEAAKIPRWDEAAAFRSPLVRALLEGDLDQYREINDHLLASGLGLQTLATILFWPVSAHLKQLSVNGHASHAQMAVATVRLAKLIRRVFDHENDPEAVVGVERRLFIARTEGTVHSLGISIVSAMFQKMGWILEGEICLRKSTDLDEVVERASCSLVAVSVGDIEALPTCRQAIRRVRKIFPRSPVRIAIGGPAVLEDSKAFRRIRADYHACSTFDVMRLACGGV